MLSLFTNHYESLGIISPRLTSWQKTYLTVRSLGSWVFQRINVVMLLLFDFLAFRIEIENKKLLDRAMKQGAVFLSVHSSGYPLLGKIVARDYPGKKIAVTFYYYQGKVSFFPIFRRFFKRLGVTVIALGGAMKEIDPILKSGGSMVLFLDAKLPINRVSKVKMFGLDRNLSTGAYFLAKKYGLLVVPLYVVRRGLTLKVKVLPNIPYKKKNKEEFNQDVAEALEKMIAVTLPSWQIYDRFLLD